MFVPLSFCSFAVLALNKGLSMSVVSRLLGHGNTDITEKVYARFLPVIAKRFRQKETLSSEVDRLTPAICFLTLTL